MENFSAFYKTVECYVKYYDNKKLKVKPYLGHLFEYKDSLLA